MNDDFDTLDEDLCDPFELLGMLGFGFSPQEDDEDDEYDDGEMDDDVYLAELCMFASSLGNWGQFAEGLAWDGARDLSDEPEADELSLFAHVRLVMDSRREDRRNSQAS
jgi:hypothetical protein